MVTKKCNCFLKKDPFCRIFLGQQVQQTSTCSHGAKNPKWGDTLVFSNTGDQELRIEVWDNEMSSNKSQLIGLGSVNLSKIMTHGVGTSSKNILI
jgi:Ca2+-dependent lipid-binding protein